MTNTSDHLSSSSHSTESTIASAHAEPVGWYNPHHNTADDLASEAIKGRAVTDDQVHTAEVQDAEVNNTKVNDKAFYMASAEFAGSHLLHSDKHDLHQPSDEDTSDDEYGLDDTDDEVSTAGEAGESVRFRRLQKKLRKLVSWAIRDYNMIEEGDVVMVCVSGGKDSYTLLDILCFLQRIAPVKFDVVAVNLDQKQPNYPEDILPNYLSAQGIPHYILEKDTYSVVKSVVPEGKTYCSACSRLRRGSLYGFAKQIGATKIALGHHRDDILATFFLNLFHGGALKAMPPKLLSDDEQNILIRPLAYVEEKDIVKYAAYKKFPIIPCNLCGSQENLQRAAINDMLRAWDNAHPQRLASMFKALQNVAPSQLADRSLFDFEHLTTKRDDVVRDFEGTNIQVGVSDKLAQIGLPTNPRQGNFDPTAKVRRQDVATNTSTNVPAQPSGGQKPQRIVTINPVLD